MDTPTVAPTETSEQPKKSWSLLASEAFGDQFHGEVAEYSSQPVAEQEQAEQEEHAQQPEQIQQEAQPEESHEERPIESMDELVRHYELDPDWMDTLDIPVKINGAEGKAKLSDLKASYQIKEAAEARLRDAKEKSRAEIQIIAEKREQLQSQFAVVGSLIDKAEKSFTKDETKVDWEKLRQQDPAEWSAKREEFKQRREEIERLKREAVDSYRSTIATAENENKERQQQYLQEQAQQLVEKLPEWKDPETAKAEKTAVAEYLINQGFTHEDISAASDHRMVLMARKAMLYDKGKDKSEVTAKKLTKIPKVLKPGSPKPQEQVNRDRQTQVKAKLKATGSLEDALEILRSRRKG
jgi:hypothetical protein